MTWERRRSHTLALLAPNAGSIHLPPPRNARPPSHCFSSATSSFWKGPAFLSRGAGLGGDLPGWPLSPWWRSALDPRSVQPQRTRLAVACFCFRTIFFILLFSQYLKNVAVPVPPYGRRKCHTSKFYVFQVFPVRSTLPSSILSRRTWRVRGSLLHSGWLPDKMPSHLRCPPGTGLNPPVVLTIGVMPSRVLLQCLSPGAENPALGRRSGHRTEPPCPPSPGPSSQ